MVEKTKGGATAPAADVGGFGRRRIMVSSLDEARHSDERMALALASHTGRKAVGLLFAGPNEKALLLTPCCDVHTVGMRHAIDVAFVDGAGRVVEAHRSVGPLRRLRNRKAVAVIERFSSCDTPWFSMGDQVAITRWKELR